MATLNLDPNLFPDQMNLRMASVFMDLSEQRLRILAREAVVPSHKDDAGNWFFVKAELTQYMAEKPTRTRKSGGGGTRGEGKAWIIRVPSGVAKEVSEFLATKGIKLEPRYNYAKQAEYRKARQAALKAEKAAKPGNPAK